MSEQGKGSHAGVNLLSLIDSFEVDPNFRKFPVQEPPAKILKGRLDDRQEIRTDRGLDLPDYGGAFREDLRFTDFSKELLVDMLRMNAEYRQVWIGAWLAEVENVFGRDELLDMEWAAWRDGMAVKLAGIFEEFMPPALAEARLAAADLGRFVGERPAGDDNGIDYDGPFAPDDSLVELSKEELVGILLGSHEYMLQCNQGISMQVLARHGLNAMTDIAWTLWSDKVLPNVKHVKEKYMKITGHEVADFMKDLQIDATALPGKAFDVIFDMPDKDVGIMTFNRCVAAEMWEMLGREDVLEQGCHATCPASFIGMAKLYNPNMKLDILAIPPRVDTEHVCCSWKLSMRDESDPEYVQIQGSTPKNED